ncbi:hypothetical protein JHK84_031733 [Glycine max]|nr:hypothetical protein JHK84_031733 [Glycine max]
MEKLQLNDDSPRTEMSITGKLNPEHHSFFLKVQISDKDGECDVLDDASSICSCTVDDDQKEHNKASMRKDKYPEKKSNIDRNIALPGSNSGWLGAFLVIDANPIPDSSSSTLTSPVIEAVTKKVMGEVVVKVFGGGGSMQRRRVLMKGLRWKESETKGHHFTRDAVCLHEGVGHHSRLVLAPPFQACARVVVPVGGCIAVRADIGCVLRADCRGCRDWVRLGAVGCGRVAVWTLGAGEGAAGLLLVGELRFD